MIVIIGAGVAGLSCATHLKDAGVEALVLEASDAVGGRIRTDEVDGFRLDRGFQVFLTSYPEAKRLLDYDALDFQPIPSGARVRNGNDFFIIPNPLKNILAAPQALFAPVGGLIDKVKVAQLGLAAADAPEPDAADSGPQESTLSFLKSYGYSDTIIDRFFIPFFRGVFLERQLDTDSSFFRFLYKHFATGDVVLPARGMQAIPTQIAANLTPEQLRLNTRVRAISGRTVLLESGESIEAETIVVATDAQVAAKLLGEQSPPEFNRTTCMYFASSKPIELPDGSYLIINSNAGEIIDHVLVVSDVAPSYAPTGQTLISVNTVGTHADIASEESVRNELEEWFGTGHNWRHLRTYFIADALQRFTGVDVGFPLRVSEHVFRCGDYAAYPSLNAAMKTGRQVAEMITRRN